MSDGAEFVATMMRACWLTAVAYIGYNIFVKITCGEVPFPPPGPGDCVSSYQDFMCGECMEPEQECTGSEQYGAEPDPTGRDTCCHCGDEEKQSK